MSSSPQKRKITDVLTEEPSLSRSGRVRKPKVFYDPSVEAKRRSMPNMETAKSKKPMKAEKIHLDFDITEIKKPEKTTVPPEKVKRDPPVNAAAINARRKTVCAVVYDTENGCIVCNRSDIKKGRFVDCINCIKRGHFTCLRNHKLYKTADQEHNWQCPACKVCEYCRKSKPSEQLYKCILCLNSYHLHCSSKISPLPKTVVKKKFTCGFCTKGSSLVKQIDAPPKSLIPNRKSEGFPGFAAHEETSKVESNFESKSSASLKIKKAVSFLKAPGSTTSTTTTTNKPSLNNKIEVVDELMDFDLNIKVEKKSPTPEQDVTNDKPFQEKLKVNIKHNKVITVRKDLVPQTKFGKTDGLLLDGLNSVRKSESDDDRGVDIEYDKKTVITPHESIPDVRKWSCDEVSTYFEATTTSEFAQILKDNQIDGDALLLIRREDVLNRFNLSLGKALRLYSHIVSLQYKNNNPILAWNDI